MKKARDIFFSVLSLIITCVVAMHLIVAVLVPSYERPQKSYLEGRSYQVFPEVTIADISDGSFQDGFETYLADAVPKRDRLIVEHASLERGVIQLANCAFGYESFPSFFESDYVYSPNDDVVMQFPVKRSKDLEKRLNTSADVLKEFMQQFSDVRWRMVLTDRSTVSLANPAHSVVSQSIDNGYLEQEFLSRLSDTCTSIDVGIADIDLYKEQYFQTDHHWRIRGAFDAYSKVIGSLGMAPIDVEFFCAYNGPFYGSNARSGLCVVNSDVVDDVEYHRSSIAVTVDGQASDASFLDSSWSDGFKGYKKLAKYANVYSEYFHTDVGIIDIENLDIANDKTLVIIGDSYTNNCERLYAEHYQHTFVIDPREYDGSIMSFFKDHDVDDVVFIWSYNNASDPGILKKFST